MNTLRCLHPKTKPLAQHSCCTVEVVAHVCVVCNTIIYITHETWQQFTAANVVALSVARQPTLTKNGATARRQKAGSVPAVAIATAQQYLPVQPAKQ